MAETAKAQPTGAATKSDSTWNPEDNPAVAELLDHIAEMLAVEYVRLIENAAQDQGSEG